MQYYAGDLVRITGTWTNAAGAAVDPDVVLAWYKAPGGTATSLTYGVDAALEKDSTGVYHVDIDANEAGTWRYRFQSTGDGQAVQPDSFYVYALPT